MGMKPTYNPTHRCLDRRTLLRGAGVALALPMLSAMTPVYFRGANAPGKRKRPRRMLAICNNLGLLPAGFFPKSAGRDYELSPYLKELAEHRNDFTAFSGVGRQYF